ncbi:integumentary mucin C.1 isoform X1 [Hyalella azteca]|uniref:Integumentary mucin C.1 isoform X1 n=1 Tax=Hyalella azteca TaxID=294128 RepID=A0A8B7PDZ5_HYAAZ|nr:integumentary mucin C.1 isoform X1 [Hyalella azteca]
MMNTTAGAVILMLLISVPWCRAVMGQNGTYCVDVENGFYCQHCWQVVYCLDFEGTPTSCDAGYTCEVFPEAGVAACVPKDSAPTCACTTTRCDPYDSNYVDVCNTGGIYDVTDCTPEGTCTDGKCVAETTTTTVGPTGPSSCDEITDDPAGWHAITPACTDGFYCTEAGDQTATQHCDVGQYVDENGDCQSAPPIPCASGCKGLCPDDTNCTQYYVCDGAGGISAGPLPCPNGNFFDPDYVPPSCVQGDDSVCAPLTFCSFDTSSGVGTTTTTSSGGTTTTTSSGGTTTTTPNGSTTTTTSSGGSTSTTTSSTPSTCSAETAGNYPYGSCSQLYWACRDVGQGNYQWVQMQCPGNYVFSTDPNYPYCVTPASEATCSAIRSNH